MRRGILTVVAALAAVYGIAWMWKKSVPFAGLDFYIYYVNAQVAGPDAPNIYSEEGHYRIGEEFYARAQSGSSILQKYDAGRRRRIDSVSSPFLYTTLQWVSGDYDLALQQYHALLLVFFVAGMIATARACRIPLPAALLLMAGVLLAFRGVEADIRVGNVNCLQFGAIGLSLIAPPLLSGVILGLLVAFKPNLILVPALLAFARLLARDWKRLRAELAGEAAGVIAALIAASLTYGTWRIWLMWVGRAGEFYQRLQGRGEGNIAPALPLFQKYGVGASHLVAAALTLVVGAAIARSRCADSPLVAGAAVLVYLIGAPVVWPHYMVLVLPAAIALMRWRDSAALSFVALLLIAQKPLQWLQGKDDPFASSASMTALGLVLLFAGTIWKLGWPAPPERNDAVARVA